MTTIYTNNSGTSSVSTKIIPLDEIGVISLNDEIFLISRVSTPAQSHLPYEAVLRAVCRQLGCGQTFERLLYKYKGNGSIAGALSGSPYFIWLEKVLRSGLRMLGMSGVLYVVFVTRGRIFRPPGYDKDDTQTWNSTQADHDAFDAWLYRCFGHDAERIVFCVVFDCDGVGDRQIESDLGVNYKAQQNGKTKPSKQDRRRLRLEVERLSVMGLNAGEILRHLERKLEPCIPHISTIRHWVKNNGTQKKRGKRKQTKCQDDVRFIEDIIHAINTLTPLFSVCESDVDSNQGYIHNNPTSTHIPADTHSISLDTNNDITNQILTKKEALS